MRLSHFPPSWVFLLSSEIDFDNVRERRVCANQHKDDPQHEQNVAFQLEDGCEKKDKLLVVCGEGEQPSRQNKHRAGRHTDDVRAYLLNPVLAAEPLLDNCIGGAVGIVAIIFAAIIGEILQHHLAHLVRRRGYAMGRM